MSTVAQILARGLKAAGVARVFGLPGGEVVHALDAIRREGPPFVLTRHETAAALMASATAQLTRTPGACLTTLGPGATNVVTGLAHAYLDRTPVILVTGQLTDRLRPDHTHQYLDLHDLFRPISKGSWELWSAGPEEAVARALQLAQQGRPGPVHLQLTNEQALQPARSDLSPSGRQYELGIGNGGAARERGLELAAGVIRRARRPLLLCGLGLEPEGPYAELCDLAEALHAPVITMPKAKGALPEDHPLSAGVIGLTHSDPAYAVLEEADCVLALGFDPVELVRPWRHPAPLIWVAPWANADPVLPAAAEIVGPLSPALGSLAQVRPATEAGWGAERVGRHRAELRRLTPQAGTGRMTPQQVLAALREALPEETIVSVDVGSHKILACLDWPMSLPNRFLVSNGLSSMGYALPAAIAAGLVQPGTTALCLTGDAGLAMTMGELGTLADAGGPVVVVAFKDDALDLIRHHQREVGLPPFGTEFQGPDFVQIAEAHGVEGVRAANAVALAAASGRTRSEGRPILIEALIDPAAYRSSTG
jgi:acetolactate synthase-1/2/3 large subunit